MIVLAMAEGPGPFHVTSRVGTRVPLNWTASGMLLIGHLRLIGAVLLEANDEWQLQHRYMQVEAMAELLTPMIEIEGDITPQDAAPIPSRAA